MGRGEFDTLILRQLQELYHAENQLFLALPRLVKQAKTDRLKNVFHKTYEETKRHIDRLTEIFSILEEPSGEEISKVMEELVKTAEDLSKRYEDPLVREAGLIGMLRRIGHYEMGLYTTTLALVKHLDNDLVTNLLQECFTEEDKTNKRLYSVGEGGIFTMGINQLAATKLCTK